MDTKNAADGALPNRQRTASSTIEYDDSERLSADSPPSTTREQNNLTPRLSTEVWETIIDHVASIFDRGRTRDLAACARVCHAWVPRAKMHLFRFIATGFLKKRTFLSLENSVRSKPFLLKYTRNVSIRGIQTTADVETTRFLVTRHMPNLEQCNISDLKLERSHPLLPRFPSGAKHVKKLVLTSCVTEDINQLGRFVTSFRSLSTLILFLDDDWSPRLPLSHLQFNRPKCSLSCLTIKALSGISVLLGYFITAHPFISHLKHLIVSWSYDKLDSVIREITDLLHHCSQSLEELTLILGSVFVSYYDYGLSGTDIRTYGDPGNDSSDKAKMKSFLIDIAHLDDLLSTDSFPRLRRLHVVTKQPEAVSFPKLGARKIQIDVVEHGRNKIIL